MKELIADGAIGQPLTVNIRLHKASGLKDQYPENISHLLIQQVVNELRGKGKCVSSGSSAARTNWVLGEIVKGFYGKGKI